MTKVLAHDCTFRPAAPSDAAALSALARAAKASWGYSASCLDEWTEELTISSAYIERHRVMVACVDGEIAGVCALEDHRDHWMLEHVWIAPAHQRRGIGRALVGDALEAARRPSGAPIRVVSDPFAREFYANLGARTVGWIPAPIVDEPQRRLPVMEFR